MRIVRLFDKSLFVRRIRPRSEEQGKRISSIAFPSIDSHIKDFVHLRFPPFGGFWIEEVNKRSMTVPPFDGFTVVEQVSFVFGLLVVGTVVVDDRSGPEHDFDVVAVKIVDKALGIREERFVPDEIVVASGPSGINVKASKGDLVFHVVLCHLHDGLLILGVIIPDDM